MPRSPSKFIPREKMDPNRTYEGYVARSTGIVHHTASTSFDGDPDTPVRTFDPEPIHTTVDWGEVEPRQKRTEQQRLDSLTKRIADTVLRMGTIPDSLLREVQADQFFRKGTIPTMEQLRTLAGMYLRRAEKYWDADNAKFVVRKDPNAVEPGGSIT